MTAWTRHREKGHGGKTSTVPGKPRHWNYRSLGLFQQLRPTTRPVRFFCPKVKRCQRIRVKSFQNVGFRSSIDYNFSRQPVLVTTHSHLGVFLDQTVKVGRQSIKTNRPWRQAMWGPPREQQIQQRRKTRIKTSGLRVLVDCVRPLRELSHFWTSTFGGTIYPAYGGKHEAVN